MMFGMITPKSISINDEILCYKLSILAKKSIKFAYFVEKYTFILSVILFLSVFIHILSLNNWFIILILNVISRALIFTYRDYFNGT